MNLFSNDVLKFFNIALEAIAQEEMELNKLFENNKAFYQKHHHGVCNLYETTYVYMIFKALLQYEFPYTFYWEYPYPNNSKLHSDLAALNENGELVALIEFKLWLKDDDRVIYSDIQKLRNVEGCKKYIFIVGYGGDIDENAAYLTRKQGTLSEVKKCVLKTRFYSLVEESIINNNLNVFMYEVI